MMNRRKRPTAYGIRSTKRVLPLKRRQVINGKSYTKINLFQLGPTTLTEIMAHLPPSEDVTKVNIVTALLNKHYKQTRPNIYFGPPLHIDGKEITHVNPNRTSEKSLKRILGATTNQNPCDRMAIYHLKASIRQKEFSRTNLPFKKRRFY